MKYSVVIPVYNSAAIVGLTIDRTVAFFSHSPHDYEIILVNDGSRDDSWRIIAEKARANPRIVAINLLQNYGQHAANLCGFRASSGDYVVTMDDDMQNPPEEIQHLINTAAEGYDLVIGQFRQKQHALYRRLGAMLIRTINRRIFKADKDLVLTNFRLIRKDVIERICNYQTSYPYISGLALMFSNHRTNVLVEHLPRAAGKSTYSLWKILKLVSTLLFNYSSYPLRLVASIGVTISGLGFALGLYYLIFSLVVGVQVPGWTTLVVLLSFFNGVTILILSMIGEYCVRLINQVSSSASYHVKDIVRSS